jgi:rhomboid protease GluP
MSHIEPTWGAVVPQAGESFGRLHEHQQAQVLSFRIALGGRMRKRFGVWRPTEYSSKGTLRIVGDRMMIHTTATRLFGGEDVTEMQWRTANIYNVHAIRRNVQFEVANGQGGYMLVIIRAADKLAAATIAAALPCQTTPGFASSNHERLLFNEQVAVRTPEVWATRSIVLVNLLVFALMVVNHAGFVTINPAVIIDYGSNFAPDTLHGQWWRLLTANFVHLGFAHLTINMIVLVRSGRIVERLFGTPRFVALYLFAGLTGSLMSLLWHPGVNSAGASGPILGVLGGLLAYMLRYRDSIPSSVYSKYLSLAGIFVCYSLFSGLTHRGVDNGAHFGGLIGGFMIACLLAPPPIGHVARPGGEHSFAIRTTVGFAVVVVGLMVWALELFGTHPDRQQETRFTEVLREVSAGEQQARADLKALPRKPTTEALRLEYAQRIRNDVLPEWSRLYDAIDHAPLPEGSARQPFRATLLRYYGDMCQAMRIDADLAAHEQARGPDARDEVKRLLEDAKVQALSIRTGAMRP